MSLSSHMLSRTQTIRHKTPQPYHKHKHKPHITQSTTINWMRHLLPQNEINQSLTDLLIQKEQDLPFVLHLLEDKHLFTNFAKTSSRNNNNNSSNSSNSVFNINSNNNTVCKRKLKPEKLFHASILEKIYQLRDIFLHFDKDRSRTLEISELCSMFNSNKIPITKNELIDLFTHPGEQRRKSWQYKVTFLDFVEFCLNEQCQHKYRTLMTKIKNRTKNKVYIPMSLQQTLEYIYNETKIQSCFNKIQKGIKKIEQVKRNERKLTTKSSLTATKRGLLYKIGFGRGVNSGMVCKAFHDIIEINGNKLMEVEKEIQVNKFLTEQNENDIIGNTQCNTQCNTHTVERGVTNRSNSNKLNIRTNKIFTKHQLHHNKAVYDKTLPSVSITPRVITTTTNYNDERSPKVIDIGRNNSFFGNWSRNNQLKTESTNITSYNVTTNPTSSMNSYYMNRNSLIRKFKKTLRVINNNTNTHNNH